MIEMIEQEIESEEEAEGTELVSRWHIENDQDADWAVQKIQKAKAELDRWRRYYGGLIEKVESNTERTVEFFTERLKEYFDTVPHKETKTTEKYPLPSGDLILKKPKTVWNHDDGELLDWLKKNGFSEFVKVTEKPDWAGFKKRLTEGSDGVICESETGLVCDVVKSEMSDPDFEVK